MTGPLEGLRILVVGGTSGIGLASARRMLAEGAGAVTLAGRKAERGAAALDALDNTAAGFVHGDAGNPDDADRIVAEAADRMGGIDVLLSCAGGDPMPRLLKDIPTAELMADVTNTLAPVITPCRAVYPVMAAAGGGAILCVASDAGKIATPGEVAIGAAMGGIAMFCRGMAIEAKRQKIRVNCLTPSVVRDTPLYETLMANPFARKLFSKAETMADLGVVESEDLAALAVFLASPAAARITGQTISVTGGISAL
ncbi:MAG: SDR family oxidoreductase [Alphaproteobacteria bacterium]|nr:SDR family oxidoreductase [Alphaproteobacteria bacterium]